MNIENFKAVIDYFKDLNINLSPTIQNSIEDVFRENDEVGSVDCYHREDIEDFETDLSPMNEVSMFMDGSHKGTSVSFFTYYGDVEHDLYENIIVHDDNGDILTEISNIEGSGTSKVSDPDDYVIMLVERTSWKANKDEKSSSIEKKLMIYCPISADGLSDEDARFQGIYNEIKDGEDYEQI